jgi:hypothetical protein
MGARVFRERAGGVVITSAIPGCGLSTTPSSRPPDVPSYGGEVLAWTVTIRNARL